MIMSRLLDLLSAGALKAGDKWYDPSLAKIITQAAKKKTTENDSGEPPKKKQKTNKGKHDNEKDTKEPKNSEAKTQNPKKCKSSSKKKGKKKTTADSGSDVKTTADSGSDLIFKSYFDDGRSVTIYQGGYMRANDLEFLREIGVGLVVNVTYNIDALGWIGQSAAPRWLRFINPEPRRDTQVLFAFNRFLTIFTTPFCAARTSSSIAAQGQK